MVVVVVMEVDRSEYGGGVGGDDVGGGDVVGEDDENDERGRGGLFLFLVPGSWSM